MSLALGDVDGDGDLDLVAGSANNQANRLYLNDGTSSPFSGVTPSDVSGDAYWTMAVALGDVDGDGDLDLLAGNRAQPNRLYLNNGTATPFGGVGPSDVSGDTDWTVAVALGDVDGDGDLDLAAGNWGQANRLYLNDGTPDPFNEVLGSDVAFDTHDTYSVALGDVDGDGDLDLVVGNSGQTNRLFLNNGSGTFAAGSDISADIRMTRSVALGDVDGDGDLDLVAGNNSQTNRLYLNNGSGSFGLGSDISIDTHITRSVALGDVDGDGDLDLVAGNSGQVNRLYLNDGSGAFGAVANISADTRNTQSVALGDVDGDGDLDLLVGNQNQANQLYLNDGTGSPFSGVTGTDVSPDAHATYSVALGDVDEDGDLDLVAGNYGQANRLYPNNGSGTFAVGRVVSADAHNTWSVALGDVDRDGDLDLVAGNYNGQANRLYLNNGTIAPFSGVSGSNVGADTFGTRSVALGDVDRDGDLDVLGGNALQANRLYRNDGTTTSFTGVTGSSVTTDAHGTRSIALGDVDGDGDLDLLAANGAQASRLYLNNGTPSPFGGVSGSDVGGDAHTATSLALGDVDGDGDLDLVVGNYGAVNRLHLNNGTPSPFGGVSGSDVSGDAYSTYSVVLGDVDGDGDLDLVAGNVGEPNRLYLNNGTPSPFSGVTGSDVSADARATYSVALGDVDRDGDLDLVAGNYNQANRLYLNDGTASPFGGVSGSNVTADAHDTRSVALGDVDGDGDLDLVAGNAGEPNRLYLNDGTATPFGGVSGSDVTIDADSTFSVALGDVDGDGDLDLVAGNQNQPNRLYLNDGTATPFSGVSGSDVSDDAHTTFSVALEDVDGEGTLDLMAGNGGQANRLYRRALYHTGQGQAGSLTVDTETGNIGQAMLIPAASLPPNTHVTYRLSNNGGAKWFVVQPGVSFAFPTTGTDLRWRAELYSLSPVRTPRVDQVLITAHYYAHLPLVLKD